VWTNYCYLDCSDSILKVDQCDEGDAESHPESFWKEHR